MAELNLKQITDKLNSEFVGDVRKLVFWYDAGAEFVSDIDSLELEHAKILKLEHDNQFYIKYFLEREDTITNYLVYALRKNFLRTGLLYFKLTWGLMKSINQCCSIISSSSVQRTEPRNSMNLRLKTSTRASLRPR